MAKPFYAEYVNHMLRHYLRHPNELTGKNEIEFKNWTITKEIVLSKSQEEQDLLTDIYSRGTLSVYESVKEVEKERNIPANDIFALINRIAQEIAKARELI